jgi:hypothetical protein
VKAEYIKVSKDTSYLMIVKQVKNIRQMRAILLLLIVYLAVDTSTRFVPPRIPVRAPPRTPSAPKVVGPFITASKPWWTWGRLKKFFKPDKMRDLPETDKRFFTYIPDDTVLDARIEKMIYEAVKEKGEEGLDKDFWMKAIDHMRTKQFITAIKVLTKRSLERINSFDYKVNNIPKFEQEVSDAISGAISLVDAAKTLEFPRLAIYGTRGVQQVLAHATTHLHLIIGALIPNLKVKYGMIDDRFPQLEQIIKDAAKREEEYYITAKRIVRDVSFLITAFNIYANVVGDAAIAAIDLQNRLYLLAAESTRRMVEVLRRGGQGSLLSKLIIESEANETSIWDMLNNNTMASDLWKKISGEGDQQRIVIEAPSPPQEASSLSQEDSINAAITSQEASSPSQEDSINAAITSIRKMRRGRRIADVRYTHLTKQAGRRQKGLPSDFIRDGESIEDAWQRWYELSRRKKATYIFLLADGSESRVANTIAVSPVEVNASAVIRDNDIFDIFIEEVFNSEGDEDIKLDMFAEAPKNIFARSDNGSDIRSVLENISEDGLSELIDSFYQSTNEYDDMKHAPLEPNDYDFVDIKPEEYISEDLEFPPFNSEDTTFQQARRLTAQNATHSFHYIIQDERAYLWLIRKTPCESEFIRAAAEIVKSEKAKEKLVKTATP